MAQEISWLVVANSETAYIYQMTNAHHDVAESLQEPQALANNKQHHHANLVHELHHPESRLQERDLKSDKPGIFHQGMLEWPTNAHKEETIKFAKELAGLLEKEYRNKSFTKLELCIEKSFYGLLKANLSIQVSQVINHVTQKNYVSRHKEILNGHLDLAEITYWDVPLKNK